MVDPGSTGKQIVFVVTLLGIFFVLVMAMPSGFYVTAPDYEQGDIPDYWSAEDIRETKYWGNTTMDYDSQYHSLTIGEGTIDETVRILWTPYFGDPVFWFQHYWYQWGWWLVTCSIEPWPLFESEVRANIDDTGNASRFEMHCGHMNYVTYFSNNSTYANLTEALDDGHGVVVSMGVGWDYESGVLSGWDLIARLLTFQLPDIRPEINAIIALPLLTLIGFLIFLTITMIINMLPFT